MRLFVLILLPAILSCGSEQSTDQQQPSVVSSNRETAVQTALQFVNDYVAYNDSAGVRASSVDWLFAQPNVTETFKQKLKEAVEAAQVEESGLDADPIINAQDFPEQGFEFDSCDSAAKFIVVRAIGQPEFKVTVKVIEQQGKFWLDGCGEIVK